MIFEVETKYKVHFTGQKFKMGSLYGKRSIHNIHTKIVRKKLDW